jgi:hypothetical protein
MKGRVPDLDTVRLTLTAEVERVPNMDGEGRLAYAYITLDVPEQLLAGHLVQGIITNLAEKLGECVIDEAQGAVA